MTDKQNPLIRQTSGQASPLTISGFVYTNCILLMACQQARSTGPASNNENEKKKTKPSNEDPGPRRFGGGLVSSVVHSARSDH